MKNMTAKDIMNTEVLTVPIDWTVRELAQFFIDKAITGAPVTDDDGKLVGAWCRSPTSRAMSPFTNPSFFRIALMSTIYTAGKSN